MAYGFEATNDNGKVIINDTVENLHFVSKATRTGDDGGGYSDFPQYSSGSDYLDGRVIHTYTVSCTGTPIVFIKPNDYSRWHAIIKQSVSSNTWTFQVLISGTSTSNPPDLYCFVNADDIPVASGDTWGMQVFKSDGTTKTFDSRKQPLAITGGGSVSHPSDPTDSSGLPGLTGTHDSSSIHFWNYSNNDHDFRSTTRYNEYSNTNINASTTMFSCPSLAQGVHERTQKGYKVSTSFLNPDQHHYSTALWWVMYRGVFRLRSGYFDAGWNVYIAGYQFTSWWTEGGIFGGGGGNITAGTRPYTPKNINMGSNSYIIADSSRYD
jgi:hypothetical protein